MRAMRGYHDKFLLMNLINALRLHAREVGSSGKDNDACRGIAHNCMVIQCMDRDDKLCVERVTCG